MDNAVPAVAPDCRTRWAAWLERGRVHERRARRRFAIRASVLLVAAAIVSAFFDPDDSHHTGFCPSALVMSRYR
jgi:hypothetical protein